MSSNDNTFIGEAAKVEYGDDGKQLLNVHSGNRFGDYILIEKLGSGGMGTVWKAEHFQLKNRFAAIKFITEPSLELLERFRKEIESINEIRHPNIINILTCNWEHQPPFYVMDYIAGQDGKPQDLSHIIAAGEIALEDVLKWTKQAASALEAAHKKNVIHRDIKPANLLLDAEGNIYVCDFGLAKVLSGEGIDVSKTGQFIGTLNYASPEQQRGDKNINHQTDIFSLGCVFYEMLTGERASGAPPSAVRDDVSDAWDKVYWKMTFPKLERRYQTMTDVLEALNKIREQETASPVVTQAVSHAPAAPGVEPLMERGKLFLEDSDWKQAVDYFNRVLDVDPKYAAAYMGLLCAELKVQTEEQLGSYGKPISEYGHFAKAIRFADSGYKQQIEGYDEAIRERLRKEQYDKLVRSMKNASEDSYRNLASDFRAMNGYKDTAALAEECDKRYRTLKTEREERLRQERYDKLVRSMENASEDDYRSLARGFRAMDGYKDTAALAEECDKRYQTLKAEREERIRQEETEEVERRRQAEEERERQVERDYQMCVFEKNDTPTEDQYLVIAARFRRLEDYKDSAVLAEECVEQNKRLKGLREEREEQQYNLIKWTIIPVSTGLCGLLPLIPPLAFRLGFTDWSQTGVVLMPLCLIVIPVWVWMEFFYLSPGSPPDSLDELGKKAVSARAIWGVSALGFVFLFTLFGSTYPDDIPILRSLVLAFFGFIFGQSIAKAYSKFCVDIRKYL